MIVVVPLLYRGATRIEVAPLYDKGATSATLIVVVPQLYRGATRIVVAPLYNKGATVIEVAPLYASI